MSARCDNAPARRARLTKRELEEIERQVYARYRTVDQTVKAGGEAPKAYGNWARPTIEKLVAEIRECWLELGRIKPCP